jgi:hypothetical protein
MLMVIAIIGLLTAMSLPFMKGINKSNLMASATRQLLDDVGYARHRAIAGHTTVYMLFIPPANGGDYSSLTDEQRRTLVTGQATTYSYFTKRSLGEQPGESNPDYITKWYTLPQGTFIPKYKFTTLTSVGPTGQQIPIDPFTYSTTFPVPASIDDGGVAGNPIPYIAFDYMGRLVDESGNPKLQGEYIPVAQGSIFYQRDAGGNLAWASADIQENPPDNSLVNYNVIHIDGLTGRAKVEQLELSTRK